MQNAVISARELTRTFGDKAAVNRLTLDVLRGEIFGFLGHNGAGKTTTVRLLNGVLAFSGGSATVLGLSPAADGPALRRRTGVLTETPSLDERLNARDNLTIYAEVYDVPRDQVNRRVDEMLDLFDLADRSKERVGGFSKGMKQRLALARALLHRPEILFLDEPTAGLDPQAARQVRDLITHFSRQEGHTVFMCTHNLVEAQRLCDRVGVMEHGRLLAVGTPVELARQLGSRARVEIEVAAEHVQRADSLLRSLTADVSVEHDTFMIGGVEREFVPRALAALVNAGVMVYRVAPAEPSLEDVYFALHERNETS